MTNTPNCARCENTEIIVPGTVTVSGEPWCQSCVEAFSCMCETCFANYDSDDCCHGNDGEFICYNCANKDATEENG